MNDLQAIPVSQGRFCPLIAGSYALVEFDGHTICFHPQPVHQSGESKRRIEMANLTIDLQFHVIWIFAAGVRQPQVNCRAR